MPLQASWRTSLRTLRDSIGAVFALTTATLMAAPVSAQDCNQGSTGGTEIVGTLLGAALGGLLGSQIGGGTGNKVAIGAGVLAGGLLGNKIGSSMDCEDRRYHQGTAQDTLEYQRTGTAGSWQNPESGHRGTITPTRTYQRDDGDYCREFLQTITVDGQLEEATGTACRQSDGSWNIVSS